MIGKTGMDFQGFYFEDGVENVAFYSRLILVSWPKVVSALPGQSMPEELSIVVETNAGKALDHLRVHGKGYQLVFVDLLEEMPNGDFRNRGAEMAEVLRQNGSIAAIVAISGVDSSAEFEHEMINFENAAQLPLPGPHGSGGAKFFSKEGIRRGTISIDEFAAGIAVAIEDAQHNAQESSQSSQSLD